jgi:uncharacterized membrane protein YfcA
VTGLHAIVIVAAGMTAGAINAVVGSGTLITFPVLLAFGYPPVVANVSNTLGLIPGSLAGAYGYRRELDGQRRLLVRLGVLALAGGLTGGLLLLTLPEALFHAVVPVLIALALVLVVLQPRLARRSAVRRTGTCRYAGLAGALAVYGCGVYGGYFGAAQGVLLIVTLTLAYPGDLQRLNAVKNVLVALANLTAALVFLAVARVAWGPAILIAAGAIAGGRIGARYGRRLSPVVLRGAIIAVGLSAIGNLLLG